WGVGNGEWEVREKTPFPIPHTPFPTPYSRLESYGNRLPQFDTTRAFAVRASPGISRFFGRRLALRGDQRDLPSAACGVQSPARRRGEVPADDVNDSAVVRDVVRPAPAGTLPAPHQQAVRAGRERGRAHGKGSSAFPFGRVDVSRSFQ